MTSSHHAQSWTVPDSNSNLIKGTRTGVNLSTARATILPRHAIRQLLLSSLGLFPARRKFEVRLSRDSCLQSLRHTCKFYQRRRL